MEKLIELFLEIFPGVEHEAAVGSVLNIVDTLRQGGEVAIPEGKEVQMGELIAMAQSHLDGTLVETKESTEETSSEEVEEVEAPEASEASE